MNTNPEPNPNVEQWNNFSDEYNRYRPVPPTDIVLLAKQLARVEQTPLVVDLGCGTGLSTRIWENHAISVIGIEPNAEMRLNAKKHTDADHITYQSGYGNNTGLPDGCADIVTAAHSLHWMEPESTVAEISRILRDGGVFAQIDIRWPMIIDREIDQAIHEMWKRCIEFETQLNLNHTERYHTLDHYSKMQSSTTFRYTNEISLQSIYTGDAEQIIHVLKTHSQVHRVLNHGISEDKIGLTQVHQIAERVLNNDRKLWFFCFRVRLAIK